MTPTPARPGTMPGPSATSDPKSFLIVTGDFVATGGMDRANLALARYLADRPERASTVHLVGHRASLDLLDHPRVRFYRVPRPLGSHWLATPLLDRAGRYFARTLHPCETVVNGGNCRTRRATVNWVHYLHAAWSPAASQTVRLPWPRRVKQVLAHRQFLRDERQALSRSRLIVANSRLTASQIARHYPDVADRVRVVYYGTDPDRFGPVGADERAAARAALGLSDDRPVVLFVGALGDARKGFDLLFEAWSSLQARSEWDARLLVVGAGASVPYFEALARERRLGDSLAFLGFRDDVPRLLAVADLVVSPVRYEAYGLNVHEALCREVPVLVSAESGVAERFADTPEAVDTPMRLPAPLDPTTLAECLRAWRERIPDYRRNAAVVGARLRADSWDDRMSELLRHVDMNPHA